MGQEPACQQFLRKQGWMLFCLALLLVGFDQDTPLSHSKKLLDSEFSQNKWDIHQTMDITSQQMTADFQAHKITFIGNVEVKQADLKLTADKVVSLFGENAQDIQEIIAEGDVRVQKGEKIATGQKAIYQKQKDIILVDGDPKLKQGNSFVQGDRIIIHLGQNQMEVQGRVKAAFQIPEEDKTK